MRRLWSLLLVVAVAACAEAPVRGPAPWPSPSGGAQPSGPDRADLRPAAFADLPGWQDDAPGAALPAVLRSCARLGKLPPEKSVGGDGAGGTVADWYAPCSAARRLAAADHDGVRAFFENWFTPFLVTNNGRPDGMFTGYFEPELDGSRTRTARYTVPLLGKPRDLVVRDGQGGEPQVGRVIGGRFEPYPTRAEIEGGALGPVAVPVAWVADPVDAHILHIQGSGRIRLEDGSVLRLAVAGTNGHKFVGIGKILRDRGLVEDSSMPGVRAWLKANPEQAKGLMAQNPRYVFYRPIGGDGPIGSEGVPLTPERSLAVDTRFIPLGVPLFLDTVEPSGKPLRRLMVAQDTGTAIKGVVRGDFFWGAGEAAFEKAGRMKSSGRYWVLLPRSRSPRLAALDSQPAADLW